MAEMETVQQEVEEMAEKAEMLAPEAAEVIKEKARKPGRRVPGFYLGFTLGSLIFSLILFSRKQKENAIFVGLWPPTILALGLFHKLMVGTPKKEAP